MIKFGVCGWMLDRSGVEAIQRARELGFDAIEINVSNFEECDELSDPVVQASYREALSTHNITLISINLGIFSMVILVHSESEEATVWEKMRQMIDVAIAIGSEAISFPMFGDFSVHNDDEMARFSAMIRRGCDYIGDRPLKMTIENTLSNAENRKLIEQINDPRVRVLVDCYNGVWSGAFDGVEMVHELHDILNLSSG